MELLNDTRALRILFNADQRIKGHDRVETFPKKGFSTVQGYIDRLIEMCSYEFKIAAAAALFDKVPDNPMRVKMQKTNIKEASLGTSYYIFKEVDALLHNDIVVLAVQESTDIAEPKRYIGFVSGTKLLPTRGQCCYTITFGARLKDFEDDQTMWVVGNLTSYLRVFESLDAKKSMGSLPGLLLKPPILDLHSIDPVNIDPEFTNNALNIAQNQAVSRAIQSGCDDPIVLVQGPPGCGKSTTISTMVTTLVAQGGQVLSCAQTNVAIIDLAYKYMTSSNFREFDCLIDMKLSKIADDQKRDKLAPKSVEARFHGVVNAVLHVVRLRFRVQPVACFGSVNNDAHDINSILYESYQQCISSGIFQLLPSEYTRKLFCAIRSAVDDLSSDLKLIMKLIIGMRVEIAVFFRTEAFNGLLETCRPEPEANNKHFPIYTWVRQALLSEASAVFCTINIGIAVTSKCLMPTLAYIVVDEAAQALEPDVVALMSTDVYFKRLILVGDPKQLRGFCLSNRGKHEMFDRSLMERLQTYRLCETTLLNTQFRMHPEICRFISRTFYTSRLISDNSVCTRQAKTSMAPISHIFFLGSRVVQSTVTPTSVVNLDEARNLVAHVFGVLLQGNHRVAKPAQTISDTTTYLEALQSTSVRSEAEVVPNKSLSIGIICIYKAQANVVRCLVDKMLEKRSWPGVSIVVNTVDSFQGRECDVIYVALTRTSTVNTFMDDPNRVNVAISRARHNIIVVGDEDLALTSGGKSFWHSLCAGQNSMMVDPKLLKNACAYEGKEKFVTPSTPSTPSAPTTTSVRSIIAKSLLSEPRIWIVIYASVAIDPKLKDTHLL
ncbi:P-loop containing nucleoside triphosphate hydrolase protein, partial [Dissophora ornata]